MIVLNLRLDTIDSDTGKETLTLLKTYAVLTSTWRGDYSVLIKDIRAVLEIKEKLVIHVLPGVILHITPFTSYVVKTYPDKPTETIHFE